MKKIVRKNLVLVIALILSLIFSTLSVLFVNITKIKSSTADSLDEEEYIFRNIEDFSFPNYDYETILGQVDEDQIHHPEIIGEHPVEFYPSYFNPLNLPDNEKVNWGMTTEQMKATRQGIIYDENMKLVEENVASVNNGTLGKHIAADGQFYGKVSDDTPRIIKKTTIRYQNRWAHHLGVYAPAGEILTVNVDQSVIDSLNGESLTVIVGYPYRESTVHVFEAKYLIENQNAKVRMPYLYFEFKINSTQTKIGSPFGGLVTLANVPYSINDDFDITISGGIDSPSYKFGISTKKDWENVLASDSPYIWVMSPYVNHIMPRTFVLDVEDPYEALLYWHKSAMISNYSMGSENSVRPVYLVYDSYIPGALALAYQTAFKCLLPLAWCANVLTYKSAFYDGSLWGAIHEFNHQFQISATGCA